MLQQQPQQSQQHPVLKPSASVPAAPDGEPQGAPGGGRSGSAAGGGAAAGKPSTSSSLAVTPIVVAMPSASNAQMTLVLARLSSLLGYANSCLFSSHNCNHLSLCIHPQNNEGPVCNEPLPVHVCRPEQTEPAARPRAGYQGMPIA